MSEKPPIDVDALMQAIPYARYLGITVDQRGNEITTVLHFSQHLIGNPVLPALHGGVIGAFLETTAIAQLAFEFAAGDASAAFKSRLMRVTTAREVPAGARMPNQLTTS